MGVRALFVAVVGLLLAPACSDDDPDPPAATAPSGVCAKVDVPRLAGALDVDLDEVDAEGSTCTMSSSTGPATVGLSLTMLRSAPPGAALDVLRDSCDEGTAGDLALAGVVGAFSCTVDGAPTVAAVSEEQAAVLAGVSIGSVPPAAAVVGAFGAAVAAALHVPET